MKHQPEDDTDRGESWVDDILLADAARLQSSADHAFTLRVMGVIGKEPRLERAHLASLALSGGAACVTALAIVVQLPHLMDLVAGPAGNFNLQRVLAASAPFVLLAGFSWFAYRTGANEPTGRFGDFFV